MSGKTIAIAGGTVGIAAIIGGLILSRHKPPPIPPPTSSIVPSVTVNGTMQPVTVATDSTVQYVATGTPGDTVEIFYSDTLDLTGNSYTKSSLKGTFNSAGTFSASDVLTNDTDAATTFYVGVEDTTTNVVGNFVTVTINPAGVTTCPCGQISVNGTCQTQPPASISTVSTLTHYLRYNTGAEPNGILSCGGWACGFAPYTDQTCPAATPSSSTCTTPTIEYTGQGTVKDDAGNPVCGVPIEIDASVTDTPASIPYSFSPPATLGTYAGEILVDLILNNTKTDENGNFTYTIKYTISSSSTPNCAVPKNVQQYSGSTNFNIGFDIVDTDIAVQIGIIVPYTICGSVI